MFCSEFFQNLNRAYTHVSSSRLESGLLEDIRARGGGTYEAPFVTGTDRKMDTRTCAWLDPLLMDHISFHEISHVWAIKS